MKALLLTLVLLCTSVVTAWAQDTTPPHIVVLEAPRERGIGVKKADELVLIRGRVLDDSGVARVTLNGLPVALDADGGFEARLDPRAMSVVIVEATDVHGNTSSERLGLSTNKILASAGRRVALVVGIDKYSGDWYPLDNAVRDAKAVAEVLSDQYGFDDLITLYDAEATRDNIIEQVERLSQHLTADDELIIYYSGHGQLKEEFNRGYWVPVDATTNSIRRFIPNSDLQTWIGGISTKHTLLIADACFAGDVFRSASTMEPFEDSPAYFEKVFNRMSRKAITSGGVEPVMDGGGDGHSVFAYYLLKTLRENQRALLDATQLYDALQRPVINNSLQTPLFNTVLNASDEGGQFIFRRAARPVGTARLWLEALEEADVQVGGEPVGTMWRGYRKALHLPYGTHVVTARGKDGTVWTEQLTLAAGADAHLRLGREQATASNAAPDEPVAGEPTAAAGLPAMERSTTDIAQAPATAAAAMSFEEAQSLYYEGAYARAAAGFLGIAGDAGQPLNRRVEALQFTARTSLVAGDMDGARRIFVRMIEMDPLVELDPDIEPPALMRLFYTVQHDVRGSYSVPTREPGIRTIAVIDFRNGSFGPGAADFDPLQQVMAGYMTNILKGAVQVKVIERERLQWILEEHKLQRDPSLVDQATAVRMGKLLGAHALVMGSFSIFQKDLLLGSRLVDVETGEVLLGSNVPGKFGGLVDLYGVLEKLTTAIADAMGTELGKAADEARGGASQSMDAVMAYVRGVELMESGAYEEARKAFEETLQHDPNHPQARKKMQGLDLQLAVNR